MLKKPSMYFLTMVPSSLWAPQVGLLWAGDSAFHQPGRSLLHVLARMQIKQTVLWHLEDRDCPVCSSTPRPLRQLGSPW